MINNPKKDMQESWKDRSFRASIMVIPKVQISSFSGTHSKCSVRAVPVQASREREKFPGSRRMKISKSIGNILVRTIFDLLFYYEGTRIWRTSQIVCWISKIFMKLTVDFAQRYSVGWKPLEVYTLPRIWDCIKQKVSKTQTHVQEIFVHQIAACHKSS